MGRSITALVPMKGHSERMPGKNTRLLCGAPLFHWILDSLCQSEYVVDIVVDTDDDAIADDVQKRFSRVTLLSRPEDIRGDYVPMNAIIKYDLTQCRGDHFIQTHSTNPLLTGGTIDAAIARYFDGLGTYDSLFSVTRHQARMYWQDGRPINHDPEELLPTQLLDPIYEENSNFYVFSKASFAQSGDRRIGLRPQMFDVNPLEAVDIDEEQDFVLATILMKQRLSERGGDQ